MDTSNSMLPINHVVSCSVAYPFHFDTAPDPDPRIRFVETRIRIRPKIEKIPTYFYIFFSFDYLKMIYNLKILKNIENSNEKKILLTIF